MTLQAIETWVAQARAKLDDSRFTATDLNALTDLARQACSDGVRQRLLYLHAASPNIHSPLVGAALHDAVPGALAQIDPLAPELPYKCVHDAVLDGWRVIHFPQQLAPYHDREIDLIGYEFILEKFTEM